MTKLGAGATRVLVVALVLASLLLLSAPLPAYAIADPDSPPQVNGVYVFESVYETGDVGVLVDYYLDYTALPTETANQAYMAIFIDTDGTTQRMSGAPYVFQNSGYGRGCIWLYFTAVQAATYALSSANIALYGVWLVGNPMLTWTATPPKTVGGITSWSTTGDPHVLLALRVLSEADFLELEWGLDLVQSTPLGNKLATLGEDYFTNVIPSLRTMAPSAFASGTESVVPETINYNKTFGAVASGAIVPLSPVTLVSGANVLALTGAGTLTLVLNYGTTGTVVGATVAGSPVTVNSGTSNVTITGVGAVTVTVALANLQTSLDALTVGTGLDVSAAAALFSMSRTTFSSLLWLLMSILICAAVYGPASRRDLETGSQSAGKVTLLVFDLCIIGGTVLGLVSFIIAALLFIAFVGFTGYVIFFRNASV